MFKFEKVGTFGDISEGDVLLIRDNRDDVFFAEVKDVLFKGEVEEEIILSKSRNLYFLVAMFVDGKSWVKECVKVHGATVYSITNTMKNYQVY